MHQKPSANNWDYSKSCNDITNEIAKVQPKYTQSLSNLQVEYFEATKNVIQNVSNLQSTFLENNWNNFDNRSAIYTEQIKNQVYIFTENFVKACEIWNQIAFEFNWYFKREYKNVYPSIDINGIIPSKSYCLLEFTADSDIWQVSYTRARRSFSIIKYQMTIKNYVKRR